MAASTDPCSLSNPHEVVVTHWHLVAAPDFDTKKLTAHLTLNVTAVIDQPPSLVLDTRDLTILSVTDGKNGQPLKYKLLDSYQKCPAYGTPLVIDLPATERGSGQSVVVSYETSPNSSAIQWLDPLQTAGKVHPYLFTQCQAIHCRSLLPCQDTPSVKSTYTAEINVPKELTALMSAVRQGDSVSETNPQLKVYKFKQAVPIPSYLTALVIGALESREIGPRSHVWSEKEMIDKAAFEFSQTEEMLKAAEDIVGPYLWGVYDLLVLPPSFPYGGMENPCLTFVTPTLLAGDKSLANVVAHEISHSWTGNLVTNKNWEHFWLNEGFTRYLESHIVGTVWGEKERHLQQILGWKALQDSVEKFGSNNPLTALVPKLIDVDPDDSFSAVPYEKGFSLLYLLETLFGLDEMKSYLRAHVEQFKYKTIDTDQWKEFLFKHFEQKGMVGKLEGIDWNSWFYAPGMPPLKPKFNESLSVVCTELANRWTNTADGSEFSGKDLDSFTSTQIQEFLNQLLNKPNPLSVKILKRFDEVYKMNERTNSEIKFRWLRLALKGRHTDVFPNVVKFLTEQGRMKFVRPLYSELHGCPNGGKELAVETFVANRHIYHGIAANMIAKDLKL